MATDYIIADHQAWLGYLQPDGLVVSPAALSDSQVIVDRNAGPLQRRYLDHVEAVDAGHGETIHQIRNLAALFRDFLEWPAEALVAAADGVIPEALTVPLPEFGETLTPHFALRALGPEEAPDQWLLLIKEVAPDVDLDERTTPLESRWSASAAQRFERLLRDSRVPIGLISNRRVIRLIYAPRGENAGSLTFPVGAMTEVAGRLILSAFHTLLGRFSLFNAPTEALLPALLARSRDYQARVSGELAEQVLDALYELLRGFQAANDKSKGALLASALASDPDQIYRGLLTTLMRVVFLLFAEDRGLMPLSGLYQRNYALHGLFERLRADAERYPDTMDQRYGAWAQLLAVFRVVHSGCRQSQMQMPARSGYLFDPARFPFLEGYATEQEPRVLPLVADGVVYRVLHKLLILDGERLSYRTLDVEQIGSVYETMMGFRLQQVRSPCIALKPAKAHGAPTVIEIADLMAVKPKDRAKWLKEQADHSLPPAAAKELEAAQSSEAALEALHKRIARNATPTPVPAGGLVLQPTDERRRSGSHYTPRSLTDPIVRTTLEPVLEQLGPQPAPAQILELKVCDPAVGSGAFLVEACRQLADHLVAAWHAHGELPTIPPDEDEVLLARRLVAQRCLYGVDRNPMAVDLAKLSLWLATLAKDHPFTFLDHSLRSGDSLLGLSRPQIEALDWAPNDKDRRMTFGQDELLRRIAAATSRRREILTAGDQLMPQDKAQRLRAADEALEPVREAGDLVLAAFFAEAKDKARRNKLVVLRDLAGASLSRELFSKSPVEILERLDAERNALRGGELPVTPFHWEIEFPEVFAGQRPGFDAIVGNPPFAGKNTLLNGNRPGYLDWLKTLHEGAHGNSDLVAHFFRRAFGLLRKDGCLGLIATNTIAQGDTRASGLTWIVNSKGTIFSATKRLKWPGLAAVVVSVVHIIKGEYSYARRLDGREVEQITSFLFHAGGNDDPIRLVANANQSFTGCIVLGMGFTFDDTDKKGSANSLAEMKALIDSDPRNAERIFPYLGGEEVNESPTHAHHRFVVNFGAMPLCRDQSIGGCWITADEVQRKSWLRDGHVPCDYPLPVAADWPRLLDLIERRVRPERTRKNARGDYVLRFPMPQRWWQYAEKRPGLTAALAKRKTVLVVPRTSKFPGFTFISARAVTSENLVSFMMLESGFCVLQCRVHEEWARFTSSTLEDRLGYRPSDCFETFPFPSGFEQSTELSDMGGSYFRYRQQMMIDSQLGMTATYNRFHAPDERDPEILRLRELHAAMDRAVLDAYGWTDIPTDYEFILDYEDEDDESSRRKKPWRYRWPDEVRDEVLARLLKLNGERAREEELAGLRVGGKPRRTADEWHRH